MKKQLELLSKFSKNKALPIISDQVRIQDGFLTATDLESYVKIPTSISGAGVYMISEIKKVLAKYPDADITAGEKLTISTGKRDFGFTSSDIDDYPRDPEVGPKVGVIRINKEFKNLSKFLSTDELRPAMTGVFVDKNVCIATDAQKLRVLRNCVYSDESFILPKAVMNVPDGEYEIHYNGIWVILRSELEFGFRKIDARYPDYNMVIPKYDDMEIRMIVGKSEFDSVLDDAMMIANQKTRQVYLDIPSGVLSAEDIDFNREFKAQLSFTASQGEIKTSFNAEFMRTCLLDQDDTVEIRWIDTNRPIMVGPDTLLMPLRSR